MINEILHLVPNVVVFRDALRCIKLWAQSGESSVVCRFALIVYRRAGYLFQCERIPGRCSLGDACCSNMSTIPQCHRRSDCRSLLHHHVPMVSSYIPLHRDSKLWIAFGRSWPQPVLLKQIEDGPLPVRVWNPKVCRQAVILRAGC